MLVQFKGNPKPTVGCEIEVQLLDKETLDLKSVAVELLTAAKKMDGLQVKSELTQAMVEITTPVCESIACLRENLQGQFAKLRSVAHDHNVELAISGTHPFAHWRDHKIFPTKRYQQIIDKFQWVARRLNTFGLHVHVGISDGDRAISISNVLINYIPHLLALSTSSPFWNGSDTGMESCRVAIFASFPTGGLPYFFVNWKEFQRYFAALNSTGTIQSIRDIYWDIRPHFDFGTIEVRVCDGVSSLQETLGIAALIQCLVVWIDSQYAQGKRSREIHMQHYWLAPENKWQAARYGLDGQVIVQEGTGRRLLRSHVAELLNTLEPVAKSLKCEKELKYVEEILEKGSSAARQRLIFSKTNSLKTVAASLVKELKASVK